MKYRANASEPWKELYIKALDSMPIGTIVDYDGQASDIPIGWEEVGNDYSTTEINTGKTWIDGKPIYRKTINASNIGTAFSTGVSNIDKLFFDNTYSYVYYDSTHFYLLSRGNFVYDKTTNKIVAENTAISSWNAYITIEYTKTTD